MQLIVMFKNNKILLLYPLNFFQWVFQQQFDYLYNFNNIDMHFQGNPKLLHWNTEKNDSCYVLCIISPKRFSSWFILTRVEVVDTLLDSSKIGWSQINLFTKTGHEIFSIKSGQWFIWTLLTWTKLSVVLISSSSGRSRGKRSM